MILELELLEQCDSHPMPFELMEREVFGGNRAMLLNVVRHHLSHGYIDVLAGGAPVSRWQLEAWARNPDDAATTAALLNVTLTTTARGGRYVYSDVA